MGQAGRSCSKNCLVKVYPDGQPNKAIEAYAILDDQSNRSLVKSAFFELFKIESTLYSYYLKMCSG